MPGDGFALTVGVCREENLVALGNILLELADEFLFSFYNSVFGRKAVLDVNAELCRRQIAHMTHRRYDLIAGSEVFFNRFRLGRRLDYN